MKKWKMSIVDTILIVSCLYFLTINYPVSKPISNLIDIKTEISNNIELTPKIEEYINKSIDIYSNPKTNNKLKKIKELNTQYPDEAVIVMNYLYEN